MTNTHKKIRFFLFQEDKAIEAGDIKSDCRIDVLQINSKLHNSMKFDISDNEGQALSDYKHYGMLAGIYWIWKNDNSDYVGFSLCDKMPEITEELLEKIEKENYAAAHSLKLTFYATLREYYRANHYDYDMRILMDVVEKTQPTMSKCFNEEILGKRDYIIPTYIIRKDIFRKMCVWLFDIMEKVEKSCPSDRVSLKENRFPDYLAEYLIMLYLKVNEKKIKILSDLNAVSIECQKEADDSDLNDLCTESLSVKAQHCVEVGKPEDIANLLEKYKNDKDYKDIKSVFEDYKRQKRFYPETELDRVRNVATLVSKKKSIIIKPTKRILVFRWNSVNDANTRRAFEDMGYEVFFLGVNNISFVREVDSIGIINDFLEKNTFDFVFSINYFDSVAEACYVHNTPYIAWAYDSPTDLGYKEYLKYDTSHVFLFASDEVYDAKHESEDYNVSYMPLAADIDKYDAMDISDEDRKKYIADISFVGQLYDNKLNEYLQYMADYKKAFFNGIIDFNVGRYGSKTIESVINMGIADWLSDKSLIDAVFKGEAKTPYPLKDKDRMSIFGRLNLLTNQTCTNRERLLLISMLSNHFDFKLYSTSSHEVFKNVSECGVVDYYKEMPKVFRLSKINLNVTLKSIKGGIPLRCLDIMGCRGFLLSNHQKDFEEHFTDGKNIALFESLEEAFDKCQYYLSHEDARQAVALNGYETVKKYYNYQTLITKMLTQSGLEHLLP